ncbi:MAG: ABC transporter permease [Planctomycetota bacterium]|nr:ABC transporter permease [Planctomycetota bacterium]
MNRIWPITWREFKYTALTKAFIIGSIIVPIFMFPLMIVLPILFAPTSEPLRGTLVVIGSQDVTLQAERLANEEERGAGGSQAMDAAMDQMPDALRQAAADPMLNPPVAPPLEYELLIEHGERAALDGYKQQVRDQELVAVAVLHEGILDAEPAAGSNTIELFVRPGLSPRHLSFVDDLLTDAVVEVRVRNAGIDYSTMRAMMRPPSSVTKRIQEDGGEAREYEWAKRLIPIAFMILVWIATFTSGNYLLTTTIEEKSSKVMEVLLSAASPMEIMSGKIIGQAMVSLITLCMYGGLGIIALIALSQADLIPPMMIVYLLLFFVMAYFMIASIMASVGSAVSDLHDAQSLIGPAMIVLILPLFLWVPISESPNGTLAVVTSFIPPLTPFVMILRVTASGDPIPFWQIGAALVEGYLAVLAMMWMCARIFRVGVLMQGKAPSPLELVKWIRFR